MANRTIEEGEKYGRLTVLALSDKKVNEKRHYLCRCDCGNQTVVMSTQLRFGKTRSCGCLVRDTLVGRAKHGGVRKENGRRRATPEYIAWQGMKDRCYNPNCKGYQNYGGRGITVCDRWRDDFSAFLADMGSKPSSRHSLEREKNHLGYSPENCVWAVRVVQNRNRRSNRYYTYKCETLCMTEWAVRMNIKAPTLLKRIDVHGLTFEEAISIPVVPGGIASRSRKKAS